MGRLNHSTCLFSVELLNSAVICSKVDSTHLIQLKELRSTCSILFACLRQFWSNQYGGRTHDPTFLKHVSNWLILTVS
ncbi:unnamed protein product [Trichobilharzia regenti]|nr:unnamed protein product [Trichobilharzia regenti]